MPRSLALALVLILAGCSSPTALELDLRQHEPVWEARKPAGYTYVLQRSCFCALEWIRPMEIEVRDGEIRSVELAPGADGDDEGLPPPNPEAALTIDEVFDLLWDAVDDGAHSVETSWDADWGFPTLISIDYIEHAADDEVSFTLRDFRPLD